MKFKKISSRHNIF